MEEKVNSNEKKNKKRNYSRKTKKTNGTANAKMNANIGNGTLIKGKKADIVKVEESKKPVVQSREDFIFKKENLKIIPLGGIEEIGKNITVFEMIL